MNIKCPNCGDVIHPSCEVFGRQRILCPTCGVKFVYRESGIHEVLVPCPVCGEYICFVAIRDVMQVQCGRCGGSTTYRRFDKLCDSAEMFNLDGELTTQVKRLESPVSLGSTISKAISAGFERFVRNFLFARRKRFYAWGALLVSLSLAVLFAFHITEKDQLCPGGDIVSMILGGQFEDEGKYYTTEKKFIISKIDDGWCIAFHSLSTNLVASAYHWQWGRVGEILQPVNWMYCGQEIRNENGNRIPCHKFRPLSHDEELRRKSKGGLIAEKSLRLVVCFFLPLVLVALFFLGYFSFCGLRDYYYKRIFELKAGDVYRIRKWILVLSCFELAAVFCGLFAVVFYWFDKGIVVVLYALVYCFVVMPLFVLFSIIRNEFLILIVDCAANVRKLNKHRNNGARVALD